MENKLVYLQVDCMLYIITFLCALLSLQVQVRNAYKKTIIGFQWCLHDCDNYQGLNLVLIIIALMLNLIK